MFLKQHILELINYKARIMEIRTNEHLSHIVNRGLMMYKFRGYEESKHMLLTVQLPFDVVDRVVKKPPIVRATVYC